MATGTVQCPNCGNAIAAGGKYCPECGHPLLLHRPQYHAQIKRSFSKVKVPIVNPSHASARKRIGNSKKGVFYIICIAAVVIFLGIIATIGFTNRKREPEEPTGAYKEYKDIMRQFDQIQRERELRQRESDRVLQKALEELREGTR